MQDNGLITLASQHSVEETIDRLVAAAEQADLTIFARIDHAAGAHGAGFDLRPTQLLIVGNPQRGTALMLDQQIAGIDLPVKALAWEDADGRVWLAYNAAPWMADRHHLGDASAAAVDAIAAGMRQLATIATT